MINKALTKVKGIINEIKQDKTKRFITVVALFTICFFVFNLGGLLKNVWTSLSNLFSNVDGEIKQIVIKSEGYDESGAGSVKITKSADWTSSSTAQVLYEVDTRVETNNITKDIVLVLDTSISMEGSRLTRMKTEVNELISALLLNSDNRVSIITFSTNSSILTEFTNDETVLLGAVESIEAKGDTNYYQALLNVEEVLDGYQQQDNKELIVLFLTDGYPNIDSPNQIAQYKLIKEKHPYASVYGIDYETGESVISALSSISDKQFVADSSNNTLLEVALSPEYYETFEIVEYVDNDYFYVNSIDDIKVSMGSVKLTAENNVQKIVWTAAKDEFRTGQSATMEIDLKLQANRVGIEGLYPTSTGEELSFNLYGVDVKSVQSEDTTILKNGYKVTYIANAPEGCNASINLKEVHYAYNTVELSDEKLSCDGYEFKGWEVVELISNIENLSDEAFKMPTYDVIVRGKWTKPGLNKTMDGTVYEKITLYKAVADQAVLDNTTSEFVTNSTGIKFNAISSNTNGKGVYTLASTANDEYPIHYFRGAVTNNNVLFANYCWKIVRTTETGGVKLIFNGSPTTDGQCTNTTGTSTQLTTKAFNSTYSSPARVGYMFDSKAATNYAYKSRSFTSTNTVLTRKSSMASTTYYYSKTVRYDGTNYVLGDDVASYTWESNFDALPGYYTCLSATATSCPTVYYIAGSTSSYAYYLSMSSGDLLDDVDNMIMSKTITDNGDGTYTLSAPETLKKSDWYTNYTSNSSYYKGYYTCSDHTSTTCSSLRYITTTSNYQYTYLNAANNYLYGNSFTWDGTNYTLTDTKQFWNWASNYNTLNNNHYTCFDNDGVCTTLYYVYYTNSSTAYYIQLTGGKSVENALDEMLNADLTSSTTTPTDSTIKDYIDNTWYANNMTEYTKYLENTVWCNDRSIYNLNGWNPNGGSTSSYLYFGPYGRTWSTYEPSLECDQEDSFTLSKDAGGVEGYGNNLLDYPVGLITSDEVMLAGGRGSSSNTSYYLYTNQYYWTLAPSYFYYINAIGIYVYSSGRLDHVSVNYTRGVRPAVSLMPDIEYISGDGSSAKPYVILTE